MGDSEIGKLPRLKGFKTIIGMLDCETTTPDDLARSILLTANKELYFLKDNSALVTAYWYLIRLTWDSKHIGLLNALENINLPISAGSSVFSLSSAIKEACKKDIDKLTHNPAIRELIGQSIQSTILNIVGPNVPTLFGAGPKELEEAFAKFSTKLAFAHLSRSFMSNILNRVFDYVIDRHVPLHDIQVDFKEALRNWSWETCILVEKYSGDWYSKHNWKSEGNISKFETSRFVEFALSKLRKELGYVAEITEVKK